MLWHVTWQSYKVINGHFLSNFWGDSNNFIWIFNDKRRCQQMGLQSLHIFSPLQVFFSASLPWLWSVQDPVSFSSWREQSISCLNCFSDQIFWWARENLRSEERQQGWCEDKLMGIWRQRSLMGWLPVLRHFLIIEASLKAITSGFSITQQQYNRHNLNENDQKTEITCY